ncbi:MAG TPA: LAGLIDADG family homing endonuclease [Candidatus Nanoarchaeia archaeon]|nr:LAGLIDADG family homing endonuclease [Candidatus Nanoarchaeia archaeon]
MKFDLSNIQRSKNDEKANIIIPDCMTNQLAEFIGIMVGDGHVGQEGYHRSLRIAGNINDIIYYETYVQDLIKGLFNINFTIFTQKSKNVVIIQKHSKALFYFFHEIIGIPHRKDYVEVPACILSGSKDIKSSFLRGLADADFCFTIKHKPNLYPVIQAGFKSEVLTRQCSSMLRELGIENCVGNEVSYYAKRNKAYASCRIYVNGFDRVAKFIEKVGFGNQNKHAKYAKLIKRA